MADEEVLEWVHLGHAGPPGAKVAAQSSSVWYRIGGGEWRTDGYRSRVAFKKSVSKWWGGAVKEVKEKTL